MKKFLFIDDHAVVRSSFAKALSEPFNPVEIDEAGNGSEAIEKIKSKKFDLIVMDVQMPDTDALSLVEFITSRSAGTKILVLSMGHENMYAKRFLQAGANGYISKHAPLEEVIKAITIILQNKNFISDTLADSIVRGPSVKNEKENLFDNLTKREFEIVTFLLQGKSLTDISKLLNVSTSTTGTHKARVFEKLKVSNLIELKDLAAEHNR